MEWVVIPCLLTWLIVQLVYGYIRTGPIRVLLAYFNRFGQWSKWNMFTYGKNEGEDEFFYKLYHPQLEIQDKCATGRESESTFSVMLNPKTYPWTILWNPEFHTSNFIGYVLEG